VVSATVDDAAPGLPIAPDFLGLSLEYRAVREYTGANPHRIDPLLIALVRGLTTAGEQPSIRIGGNSADHSWWADGGRPQPLGDTYAIRTPWIRTTRAFLQAIGGRLLLDLDLAHHDHGIASEWAQAAARAFPAALLAGFEVGNEPDLYPTLPLYHVPAGEPNAGRPVFARSHFFRVSTYAAELAAVARRLPRGPALVAPAYATLAWMRKLDPLLAAGPRRLGVVTFHRYPLRSCFVHAGDAAYPTIDNLLGDNASHGLADGTAPFVALAHAQGLAFRVDELNSVACGGRSGVSDSFAAGLWMTDALFEFAAIGADGVNVHTLPGARYELFGLDHSSGRWLAVVHPAYYGALLFMAAAGGGARLLPVSGIAGTQVKVWATRTGDRVRTVAINKDPLLPHVVALRLPAARGSAEVARLTAPGGAAATGGVTFAGQSFGPVSSTGELEGRRATTTVRPLAGVYLVTLAPASAALITARDG
jgi:hypothetical protein